MAVGGQLDAVAEPGLQVGHEHVGVLGGPLADEPGGDELRVGAQRRPRPHVAVPERAPVLLGHVLLLAVGKIVGFST